MSAGHRTGVGGWESSEDGLSGQCEFNPSLIVDVFYQIKEVPFYSEFLSVFNQAWVLNSVKCFFLHQFI